MSDTPKRRLRDFYDKMPIDPAQTEEGKARLQEYRLALGTFVEAFAQVEAAIFYALSYHAKTRHPIAKALFSGTRVETAAGFLRRLADADLIEAAEWQQLEPVLAQLHHVNDIRNAILHYGAQGIAAGRRAFVADGLRALTVEKMRVFPISADILADLTYDCHKIYRHLIVRHSGRPALIGKHPELEAVLEGAWRYIPPRQASNRPKESKNRSRHRPDSDPQHPPPRSASRE
jgi:hypothetical protein